MPITTRSRRVSEHSSILAHHFDDLDQQREAATLGMWTFLATEVLFFGGLFVGYAAYRWLYPDSFAQGSHHLNHLLGGLNTAILLCSSLTMALAVHAAQTNQRGKLVGFLLGTILLAVIFLGVKAFEYYEEYEKGLVPGLHFTYQSQGAPRMQLFFIFYFIMTSLHAAHMIVGIGILGTLAAKSWRGRYSAEYYNPIEAAGLYWHFVDIVWIFLYPLLYLIR